MRCKGPTVKVGVLDNIQSFREISTQSSPRQISPGIELTLAYETILH